MALEQQTTQKYMGDQKKAGKTCELAKYQTQQAKKPRRKNQTSPRLEKQPETGLPQVTARSRAWVPGRVTRKTAKPGHNYTYKNPASLSKNTCESANPRAILWRRFNPRQVSICWFRKYTKDKPGWTSRLNRHFHSFKVVSYCRHRHAASKKKAGNKIEYFRSHFAMPQSAQTPSNYISKCAKFILLFKSGGTFSFEACAVKLTQFSSTRWFPDRSRFVIFT